MMVDLKPELLLSECVFTFLRSSGKGGQNVNKVSTKVELWFDVAGSHLLNEYQKQLIINRLPSNATFIRMLSGRERSQKMNLEAVSERFVKRIIKLFEQPPERIPTRPTKVSKEERLQNKKAVSDKKSLRKPEFDID
jgi:ribosome-associated protein